MRIGTPKIFLCILAGFIAVLSIGQTVEWGPEVRLKGKSRMRNVLSADSSGFKSVIAQYRIVGKPDAIVDEYKLPSFESVKSLTVTQDFGELETIYDINGDLFGFYTVDDSQNKIHRAYVKLLDSEQSSPTEIGAIKYQRSSQKGTFDFQLSPDKSKILVIENPPYEKYSMEEFKLMVYDTDLTLLWDKPMRLPYLDQDFKIVKKKVDNAGNVYLLTAHKTLASKESNSKGLPIREYTVLIYNKEQNRLKEFDINLKDKWVNGLNLSFNNKGNLMIGGFYSLSKDYTIAGTFFLGIDAQTLEITKKSLNPFAQGFLDQFNSGRMLDGNESLDDFYFDNFVVAEDGSAYFTAEQYYVRTTSFFDYRTGVTNYTYYYHYNDIVVVKTDTNAQVLWTHRIPKRQVTTNDNGYYSGYAVMRYNEGLHILYNDNAKNFEESSGGSIRPMNNPQRSMATLYTLTKEGVASKKPLFNAKDYQSILQPKIRKRLDDDSLLIYTQKGKTFRFAVIRFR